MPDLYAQILHLVISAQVYIVLLIQVGLEIL